MVQMEVFSILNLSKLVRFFSKIRIMVSSILKVELDLVIEGQHR